MGAEHKKTRREKIIADYRHNIYILKSSPVKNINPTTAIKNPTNSYSYVLHDISKTGILTLVIIFIQIILFVLLRKHILSIPNLNY